MVHGPEDLLVDLLVDAPPNQSSAASVLGPTLGREDLAGRKLLALFDRAAPQDFVDVYVLARRYGRDLLLDRAAAVDLGFDLAQLAGMIAMLDRFTDDDLPMPAEKAAALRAPGAGLNDRGDGLLPWHPPQQEPAAIPTMGRGMGRSRCRP